MKKILLFTLALLCLSVNAVKAATIEVQNNNDSATGSLRQAVMDANDLDTIRFNPTLISSGNNTISLSSEIAFSKSLVFKGLYNSTDTLYVSGSNTNRIFNITNTTDIFIDSMVLINGNVASDGGALTIAGVNTIHVNNSRISNSSAEYGGGIDIRTNNSNNTLTSWMYIFMNNNTINNNSATNHGGGVYISGININLNMSNSIINNNAATVDGGGLYVFSLYICNVIFNDSDISDNLASSNGGGLRVASFYSNSSTVMNNCNVINNTATGTGGGILSIPAGISSVILDNSTVSNNTAAISGGIRAGDFNGSQSNLELIHSTVSGNHATNDFGGIACLAQVVDFYVVNSTISENSTATSWGNCGGLYVFGYNTANIEFISSIVWTSVGDNIKHETVDGGGSIVISSDPINSGEYNIFSDAPNGANATGDLINVSASDLNLQPLTNNGGFTLTMQPGPGSVAIDAGNPSDASDAQNMAISGTRDIGAAESSNIILVSSIAVQGQGGASDITTQGGALQMEATVLPANADDMTYTWSVVNGTGSANIDVNGILTAITDGTVEVTATANDASGITGTATVTISNQSLSVNENNAQNISIYPNPVQSQLFVELGDIEITEVSIFDVSGKVIKLINLNASKVDVSDLKQGIYFLKVSSINGAFTERFIKQ